VRAESLRLRGRLSNYYTDGGSKHPVVIGRHLVDPGLVQKISLICIHMLRMPLSVKSRFRKRDGGVVDTAF